MLDNQIGFGLSTHQTPTAAGVSPVLQDIGSLSIRREPATLRVQGMSKSYGPTRVLHEVNLDVPSGHFVSLLGPSGSGKTTLLQTIAGFTAPDSGSVIIGGEDVSLLPPHKRGLGMVFQSYALFPHMSVGNNVGYPLKVRGVKTAARRALVDEFLELVRLGDFRDRFPDQLSGGQRQRVALARALVFHPKILLMDEPLSALDRQMRQALQFEIKALQQRLGVTVVHVTHDQEEAMAMSDVVALMRDGRIEQTGSPAEIYERPRSEFAASFIGENSKLNVEPSDVHGAYVHVATGQRFRTHGISRKQQPEVTGPALMCVRPEALTISVHQPGETLAGAVHLETFMGDHWRYEVRVGDDVLIVKNSRRAAPEALARDVVGIAVAHEGTSLFPAA